MRSEYNQFPAAVYAESVLAPDFEVYKAHFSEELHQINLAHGIMLFEQGLLSLEEVRLMLVALEEIHKEKQWAKQSFDGSFEDLFFLVERELGVKIGGDTAGRLHTGRSRNDMEHTMFRMQLRQHLLELIAQYSGLVGKVLDRATEGRQEIVLLYTHGQPAQVSVLGHYLGAALEFMLRDLSRIMAALKDVNLCPMGAAAITTSGFALNRQRVSELLGFPEIVENSYGAIANVDYITGCYSALRLSCIHLGRLVQDLVYWTGFEVSQILVPDGLVQISSIMPQKRNPVPLEHLRLKFSLAGGAADQIIQTMHNTPFADMNDSERETQATGFAVFERMAKALPLLAGFIEAMQINHTSVQDRIHRSMATTTELADTLVREEQISFRAAHHVAQVLAREAIQQKLRLDHLPWELFEQTFVNVVGRAPTIGPKSLKQASSPENFVEVRELPGGPGARALDQSLQNYRRQLAEIQAQAQQIREGIATAEAQRQLLVADLISRERVHNG